MMKHAFEGRICIPIKPLHQGGGFYFIRLFESYLSAKGIAWTDDVREPFDILFADAWQVPHTVIKDLKEARPRIRLVHRVDGSGRDRGRTDDSDYRQACVNLFADATVFQSEYSKLSTRKKYKVIKHDGPVIHNPVDISTFRPGGDRLSLKGSIRICVAAWSVGAWKGTSQVPRLARDNPDYSFVLCGRFPEIPNLPSVEYLGHLPYEDLARAMRSCDMFLNLSENDPCPNVVIQALASGLPVLYKPSGGVPELVDDAGLALDKDTSNFREAVLQIMDSHAHLAEKARRRAEERFAPNTVFGRYLEVIRQSERHALPNWLTFFGTALQGYPVLSDTLWKLPSRTVSGFFK